jgi:hypothetical protein
MSVLRISSSSSESTRLFLWVRPLLLLCFSFSFSPFYFFGASFFYYERSLSLFRNFENMAFINKYNEME